MGSADKRREEESGAVAAPQTQTQPSHEPEEQGDERGGKVEQRKDFGGNGG